MAGIKWTTKETELLLDQYTRCSKAELTAMFPKRSWDAIKLRAARFGLRFYHEDHRFSKSDLSVLLEDTPLAYYWMGFLTADGHFYEKRVKLHLAKKDRSHLQKYAKFVSCELAKRRLAVSIQDRIVVPLLRTKYHLTSRKTYEPPISGWIFGNKELDEALKANLYLAYMIGFIDGDGSITYQTGRKDCSLRIKCHMSWWHFLQYFSDWISMRLGVNSNKVKTVMQKQGKYAQLAFTRRSILRYLKIKTKELDLPVLERKWSRIDETSISRQERIHHE